MDGSTDLIKARVVAKHIGSIHHEVIVTAEDMLSAIKTVIQQTETYDTTTVRASTPMYLLSKYIKDNILLELIKVNRTIVRPEEVERVMEDLNIDVIELGSGIRYSEEFEKEGTNVNFLTLLNADESMVRTYERGVEGETLSCGTGVTACALVMHHLSNSEQEKHIHALGGDLTIRFEKTEKGYENIWLCGPAEMVFKGDWMS